MAFFFEEAVFELVVDRTREGRRHVVEILVESRSSCVPRGDMADLLNKGGPHLEGLSMVSKGSIRHMAVIDTVHSGAWPAVEPML